MNWRRFIGAWALTVAILLVPVAMLWDISPQFPPSTSDYDTYLWLVLLAGSTSFVSAWVLARVPYFPVVLVVAIAVGFGVAYGLGSYTFGYEGELQHGLLVRAMAGAIVGAVAAILGWSLHRWAHRRSVSRTS